MQSNAKPDLSRQLCDAVAAWRYEDIPPHVIDAVKMLLLDGLGVIAGAANAPGIKELNTRLARWETGGSATGLLGRHRLSPPFAALANGTAGHALDFDDQHDPARVHTTCVMVATLLATAEDVGKVAGRDFLVALAIGAELHARLGLACPGNLGWGWHPTMVFGTLAGAVAAGRLLGLKDERLSDALGLAFHQASGSAQAMRDGALSKRLGPGLAAKAAVLSAFLAADGITGTRNTFEGNAGYITLYERGEFSRDELMNGLGSEWRILEYSLKPYPCCRCNHTVIGLGLAAHRDGLKPESIASVQIGLGQYNYDSVGADYEPARNNVVHAQFNAGYSFARALVDGKIEFRSYQRPAITDSAVATLTAVTRAISDPAMAKNAVHPARIIIKLKNGETRELYSDTMKGSPRDPLTRDELLTKFRACLEYGYGVGSDVADRYAEVILGIESSTDAGRALVDAFPTARS